MVPLPLGGALTLNVFRSIDEESCRLGAGGSVISSLTRDAGLFIFSFSPEYRSLISWSDNAQSILGVSDISIMRGGDLFLRYVHNDDRFATLSSLEQALSKKENYCSIYRWIRPDNNELRWLYCRATHREVGNSSLLEGFIMDISAIQTQTSVQTETINLVDAQNAAHHSEARSFEIRRDLADSVLKHVSGVLQNIVLSTGALEHFPERSDLVLRESTSIRESAGKALALLKECLPCQGVAAPSAAFSDANMALLMSIKKNDLIGSGKRNVQLSLGALSSVRVPHDWLMDGCTLLLEQALQDTKEDVILYAGTNERTLQAEEAGGLAPGEYLEIFVSCEAERQRISSALIIDPPPQEFISSCRTYGGTCIVDAEHGGSRTGFSLLLPLGVASKDHKTGFKDSSAAIAPEILLVDDEHGSLQPLGSVFDSLGFHCMPSGDIRKAHHFVHAFSGSLRLVLVSIPPILSALEMMLKRIRNIIPGLKVIGVSSNQTADFEELLRWGMIRVLTTPLDTQTLKTAVEDALRIKQAA